MEISEPISLKGKTFVSFISFSGCGHSLISSLIDAHKNAIVSREHAVLGRLYKEKITIDQVEDIITKASHKYTMKGRLHKGSNTSHKVPNQFNGMAEDLMVLGDKHGGGVISCMSSYPDFYRTVTTKLRCRIKFVHIYRNPYDVAAHTKKFYSHRSMRSVVSTTVRRFELADSALRKAKIVISVKLEDLIYHFDYSMGNVLRFLGLDNYDGFIDDCKRILRPERLYERNDVTFKAGDKERLRNLCRSIIYLNDYEDEIYADKQIQSRSAGA